MNPKQVAPFVLTLPAVAAAAPTIIIGGAIGLAIALVLKALLSEDKQKQPEIASVQASTDARKPAETTVFRQIPTEIPAKPAPVPRAVAPLPAVQLVPKAPAPVPAPVVLPVLNSAVQIPTPPIKKKFVTREDLANVFHRGTRSLTRTAAVAALKKLGFGKTAAYAALTPDGRFAAWLQFAPDGMITWTDGHKA
jgi:hypothetical protein